MEDQSCSKALLRKNHVRKFETFQISDFFKLIPRLHPCDPNALAGPVDVPATLWRWPGHRVGCGAIATGGVQFAERS